MRCLLKTKMAAETEKLEVEAKLKKSGWNLTSDGIEECVKGLGKRKCALENIVSIAADFDLKDIGTSILTEDVKRGRATEVKGPIVLQIQKVRNISAPKANEESSFAPRLLKIQLTDGHTTCFALENSSFQQLSLATPPGSKVRLKGTIPMCAGFLLLEANNIEKLGGKVEKMLSKWETNRSINEQRTLAGLDSEGPPLFVPFDVNASTVTKKPVDKLSRKVQQVSISHDQDASCQKKTQENVGVQTSKPDNQYSNKDNRTNHRVQNLATHDSRQSYDYKKPPDQKFPTRRAENWQSREKSRVDDVVNRQTDYNQGSHNQVFKKERPFKGDRPGDRKDEKKGDRRAMRYDENDEPRPTQGTLWDFVENTLPASVSKSIPKDTAKRPDTAKKWELEDHKRQTVFENESRARTTNTNNDKFSVKDGRGKFSNDFREYESKNNSRKERSNTKEMTRNVNPRNIKQERSDVRQDTEASHTSTNRGSFSNRDLNPRNDTREKSYKKDNEPNRNDNGQARKTDTRGNSNKPNRHVHESFVSREDFQREGDRRGKSGPKRAADNSKIKSDNSFREAEKYQQNRNGNDKTVVENRSRGEKNINIGANDTRSADVKSTRVKAKVVQPGGQDVKRVQINRDVTGDIPCQPNGSRGVQEQYSTKQSTSKKQEHQQNEAVYEKRPTNENNPSYSSGNMASRSQHWWNKGERCLAFCSLDRQNRVASVLNVEPRTRSCVVLFEHSQTTENVQWSYLTPLDTGTGNSYNRSTVIPPGPTNSFYFQQIPSPQYVAPMMQSGWVNQQNSSYQSCIPYNTQAVNMQNQVIPVNTSRTARPPPQQFYRPPSRYFAE